MTPAKLTRDQIVDFQTWTDRRPDLVQDMLAIKAPRRIHVGDHLTFLFENVETVRWQVQEMMRVERIVREKDIQHEIDTYNELIGGEGELGCTLLIEIDDEAQRNVLLRRWLGLVEHLYAELEDGTKIRPTHDPRQVGTDRLSSVQYLVFPVGPKAPVALGTDHPELTTRASLSEDQRAALQADLA